MSCIFAISGRSQKSAGNVFVTSNISHWIRRYPRSSVASHVSWNIPNILWNVLAIITNGLWLESTIGKAECISSSAVSACFVTDECVRVLSRVCFVDALTEQNSYSYPIVSIAFSFPLSLFESMRQYHNNPKIIIDDLRLDGWPPMFTLLRLFKTNHQIQRFRVVYFPSTCGFL